MPPRSVRTPIGQSACCGRRRASERSRRSTGTCPRPLNVTLVKVYVPRHHDHRAAVHHQVAVGARIDGQGRAIDEDVDDGSRIDRLSGITPEFRLKVLPLSTGKVAVMVESCRSMVVLSMVGVTVT